MMPRNTISHPCFEQAIQDTFQQMVDDSMRPGSEIWTTTEAGRDLLTELVTQHYRERMTWPKPDGFLDELQQPPFPFSEAMVVWSWLRYRKATPETRKNWGGK